MKTLLKPAALCLAMSPVFAQAQVATPTLAEAQAFIRDAEQTMADFSEDYARIAWINATFITEDTDAMVTKYGTEATEMSVKYALEAARYRDVPGLSEDDKRKLDILRGGLVLPAPTTPGAAVELNEIATRLNSAYGKGKGTLNGVETSGNDLEALMGTNRNPDELKEMWSSWHDNVGAPMKDDYARMVEIGNLGAGELGYADTGTMWRSGYDMPADEFAALVDQLWLEVKPLYDELHTYVRAKLNAYYGDAVQPASGPIRADLLGNMWAQEWGSIYDIAKPADAADLGYDIGELLRAKGVDEIGMVKIGENFFSSLGFDPLPESFWERSMFLQPTDHEAVCHASAWDVDNVEDLRIKMCIKVNSTDFVTIHHELGHNYYQRAYNDKSYLYLSGANDGFHEAIGDTIALSITPEYLVQIGLLDAAQVPSAEQDISLLLRQALDSVAFLPFGLLVDKWRWGVFDGSIPPMAYNQSWNDLRLQYQGITPPVTRAADQFDPGAKYHIPGNTPYMRYFLARILQFQFYKSACEMAGWEGPLHRCSFYGNKTVGTRLNAMLEMGASQPWPEALEAFIGSPEISGEAIVEYFAPLMAWLKEQNAGAVRGW
jgi:peptidyl-dipeptidase A